MSDDGIYDMVPEGNVPRGLPGGVFACGDVYEMVDRCAADLFLTAGGWVDEAGECRMLLSDAAPVERVVRSLMIDPRTRGFPWAQCRVWVLAQEGGEWTQSMLEMLIQHGGVEPGRCHVVHSVAEIADELQVHQMVVPAAAQEFWSPMRVRARQVSVLAAQDWSEEILQQIAREMHGTVTSRMVWYLDSSTERL